jgi:hypothetical protein
MPVQLADVAGLTDVLVTNHFQFSIPNPPGGGDGQALIIRNMAAKLPIIPAIAAVRVPLHRHAMQFAGIVKRDGSFTATYTDTADRKVTNVLEAWYQATHDEVTGFPKPQAGYQTTAVTSLYDYNNVNAIDRTFYGLWVGNVAEIDLDGEAAGNLRFSVTFNYNYFLLGKFA